MAKMCIGACVIQVKITQLYTEADQVLEQVARARDRFEPWIAFGGVDLDGIVEEFCKTPDQWRVNLKMVKMKSQEFAKMNVYVYIRCLNVLLLFFFLFIMN